MVAGGSGVTTIAAGGGVDVAVGVAVGSATGADVGVTVGVRGRGVGVGAPPHAGKTRTTMASTKTEIDHLQIITISSLPSFYVSRRNQV
jgi:hypothetical protein